MVNAYDKLLKDINDGWISTEPLFKKMINEIGDLFDISEMQQFYPKNFYNENATELVLFSGNKVVQILFDQEGNKVVIKTILSSISSIEMERPSILNEGVSLKVNFSDGNIIKFNSLNDSNSSRNKDFIGIIKEIYKLIIK